jgi:hypothetical protein
MTQRHGNVDPRKPHRFVERNDPGLAAMASGGLGRTTGDPGGLATTSAFLRQNPRCALEGCDRERDDRIHDVEAV